MEEDIVQKLGLPKEFKVLVLEDTESVRKKMLSDLRKLGFSEIYEVTNGAKGWEFLVDETQNDRAFNLILLDINMPKMNGQQFLKKVRHYRECLETPIIMVSELNQKEIIMDCIMDGANNYLLKPWDIDTLKEKILSVLEKK